ncbi:MAG: HD domain-containing protein [Candidatus Coprovivens sp.]
MIEAFNNYVSNYDLNDYNIKLKYNHSIRVMNLMVKYAKMLGYDSDDVELAKIIGLLHDIGRFEQLKVYHTYNDLKSVDHADYSVVQLFDKGEIKLFTNKEEWYPIIRFAIKNHNKKDIPGCNDERVLKFTKLIRDIDKLDIIYLIGVLGELNYKIDYDKELSLQVRNAIFKHESVDKSFVNSLNDHIVIHLGFVFDINNDIVLKEYKNYLIQYYERLNDKGLFKDLFDEVIKYIDERIENNERN